MTDEPTNEPECVDGHADAGSRQDVEIHLELAQGLEQIQDLALIRIGIVSRGRAFLQLLPQAHHLFLHTHLSGFLARSLALFA